MMCKIINIFVKQFNYFIVSITKYSNYKNTLVFIFLYIAYFIQKNEKNIIILKNNSIDNERRYTLFSILKYIITLEPDDIKSFLNKTENFKFLNITKNIDAISFEKTINMFQDLNDLILIFYEKTNSKSTNKSKKNYDHSLNSNKKTIRKRYKE